MPSPSDYKRLNRAYCLLSVSKVNFTIVIALRLFTLAHVVMCGGDWFVQKLFPLIVKFASIKKDMHSFQKWHLRNVYYETMYYYLQSTSKIYMIGMACSLAGKHCRPSGALNESFHYLCALISKYEYD